MARLGINQLRLLIMTASPTCVLVTTDHVSDSLIKRGLFQTDDDGHGACITPMGLRALADEMEAGRVKNAIQVMRAEAARRQDARAQKSSAREKGLV